MVTLRTREALTRINENENGIGKKQKLSGEKFPLQSPSPQKWLLLKLTLFPVVSRQLNNI